MKKDMKIINDNKRNYCKLVGKQVLNDVKIHCQNTLEHELAKAEACYHLQKKGLVFYTECQLLNGGRADILILNQGDAFAIEILHTEEEARFEDKKESYGCKVYGIRTGSNIFDEVERIVG